MGQGLIPTVFGFTVIMVLLVFAVQVVFDLYARSVVTSATLEAAHAVADAGASGQSVAEAEARAEAHARNQLGGYATQARFAWASPAPAGEVVLTASFEMGGSSFDLFRLPFLDHFSRTARVRVERVECPAGSSCAVVP